MENERKTTRTKVPIIDNVRFTGVAVVIKKGRKRQLCIFRNTREAGKYGIDERTAKGMLAGWFGTNNCITDFSIFGNVSCEGSDDCLPGKTCLLQMWDKPTNPGKITAKVGARRWEGLPGVVNVNKNY